MNRQKKHQEKGERDQAGDPLCLFYHSKEQVNDANIKRESYLSSTRGSKPSKTQKLVDPPWKRSKGRLGVQNGLSSSDETDRRRTCEKLAHRRHPKPLKRRKVRRFGKEPVRHLAAYLLTSGTGNANQPLPQLNRVLDTLTDAWPSSKHLTLDSNTSTPQSENPVNPIPQDPHFLERRRSVPEEIIRKFSVTNERTSESETNVTMPEITSPSSKEDVKERKSEEPSGYVKLSSTAFSKKVEDDGYWPMLWEGRTGQSFRLVDDPDVLRSAEEGSSDSDSDAPGMERFNTIKRAPLRRSSVIETSTVDSSDLPSLGLERASQRDYYRNGQGILKTTSVEKSSQTGECTCRAVPEDSGTTPTARDDESDSGESSESISSPRCCGQRLSSSENQSSDSEDILCTCLEIRSKETSTDPYHSGKSTLSQTVSDKTTSTQDSTASINSVSSRGSTITAATDSSSTEIDPRTSAKETTTSPDHTPRSPPFRTFNGDRSGGGHGGGGMGGGGSRNGGGHCRRCPRHGEQNQSETRNYRNTNRDNHRNYSRKAHKSTETRHLEEKSLKSASSRKVQTELNAETFQWAQLSQEELSLIHEQRQKQFVEKNHTSWSIFTHGPSVAPGKLNVCTTSGTTYQTTENLTVPFMVPRYSALPRSMSMMVNASSIELNQPSDSESLADSLEDGHNRIDPIISDTKQELKPVRGDVKCALVESSHRIKQRPPRGRAYFFAVDDKGSSELVTDIHKIPDLPETLKKRIHKRHINICKSHECSEKTTKQKVNRTKKKRKERTVKKQINKISAIGGKKEIAVDESPRLVSKEIHKEEEELCLLPTKKDLSKGDQNSKRKETDTFQKGKDLISAEKKTLPRTDDVTLGVGNNKSDAESKITPRKPQAVIHPSPISSNVQPKIEQNPPDRGDARTDAARNRQALIESLESAAAALKQQMQQKQQGRSQQQSKRPGKFQQRFEVIPEERSSSLTSSAEDPKSEKNRRRSLPVKLTEAATSPTFLTPEGGKFRRYSLDSLSNYVITKLMGRPLQAIPCVQRGPNNEDQQIIIFSPKDPGAKHSAKGRDALLAMNREDFNRLSKGWMNFYLLKEGSESDSEEKKEEKNRNKELSELNKEDENKLGKELNTIVCRIPSMEKDPPTTSGSGTDETCASPGRCSQSILNKSYLLKNADSHCFKLEELSVDNKEDIEGTMTDVKTSNLNVIYEEGEVLAKDNNVKCVNEERKENVQPHGKIANSLEKVSQERIPKLTKEASTSTEKKEPRIKRESAVKLSAPVKLSSSNTVLTTKKPIKVSPRMTPKSNRAFSLPELKIEETNKQKAPVKANSLVQSLPQVPGASTESDSDSTVYMNAPSPDIPRLILEDCCDCCSDSSSSSDNTRKQIDTGFEKHQFLPLRRRPQPFRPKNRFAFREAVHGKRPGWSVTVEGTLAFPRTRPDVQMRLSFPAGAEPPVVSQSDSGFVEDAKLCSATQKKQQWTVTVQNPQTGKEKHKSVCRLPVVSQRQIERSTERGAKVDSISTRSSDIESQLLKVWPKVQAVLETELQTIRFDKLGSNEEEKPPLLSIEGRAMSFDTKPRVPTMSERDLTRNNTARSDFISTRRNPSVRRTEEAPASNSKL